METADSCSWVFDSLVGFLHGPVWNIPLQTFIEEKSLRKFMNDSTQQCPLTRTTYTQVLAGTTDRFLPGFQLSYSPVFRHNHLQVLTYLLTYLRTACISLENPLCHRELLNMHHPRQKNILIDCPSSEWQVHTYQALTKASKQPSIGKPNNKTIEHKYK